MYLIPISFLHCSDVQRSRTWHRTWNEDGGNWLKLPKSRHKLLKSLRVCFSVHCSEQPLINPCRLEAQKAKACQTISKSATTCKKGRRGEDVRSDSSLFLHQNRKPSYQASRKPRHLSRRNSILRLRKHHRSIRSRRHRSRWVKCPLMLEHHVFTINSSSGLLGVTISHSDPEYKRDLEKDRAWTRHEGEICAFGSDACISSLSSKPRPRVDRRTTHTLASPLDGPTTLACVNISATQLWYEP
jgi:hypothetical protein